jgi:hypothetical protein
VTLVARTAKEATIAPVVTDGVCIWEESGVSRSECVFTFNLVYKEIFINLVLSMRFANIMMQ